MARDTIEIEVIELYKIHPAEWNPRQISDKERGDLKNSLQKFGCVEPLVIRKEDMSIVGGHQRCTAALELGWTEMPCVKVSLDDNEARILNIALNAIHGRFIPEQLNILLDEIQLGGGDVSLTGLEPIQLDVDMPSTSEGSSKGNEQSTLVCPKCGYEWEKTVTT